MAIIELPWIQRFRDRHGRWRNYYRRPGYQRVKLPEPGSSGFLAAYEAAGASPMPTEGAGAERTVPGTISALIVTYYLSAEYAGLRDSTKRAHRNSLERFRKRFGHLMVSTARPTDLNAIFHGMAATPAAASNLRKRLRAIFQLAVDLGWRDTNPVIASKRVRYRTKGFTPWSEEDIAAYEKRWPTGARERLALALLLYTGVRRSDVVTLGQQHVKAGRIHVLPLKTSASGTRVAIRVHPALQREIAAAPLGMNFLLTAYGEPFSAAGFTAWFGEKAKAAGLAGRTPHGLRKAAGRRLAEAGCTAKQIAAVLGHSTLAEVERYTRDANQTALADEAMARLGDGS